MYQNEPKARAIPWEERHRGNGGGRGPNDKSWWDTLCAKWAQSLVNRRLDALESRDRLTPQEAVERNSLRADFERVVNGDGKTAAAIIWKYSDLLNNPVAKAVLS